MNASRDLLLNDFSVRELIAKLAQLEDRVRQVLGDAGEQLTAASEEADLVGQQEEIMAELRRRSLARGRAEPSTSQSGRQAPALSGAARHRHGGLNPSEILARAH